MIKVGDLFSFKVVATKVCFIHEKKKKNKEKSEKKFLSFPTSVFVFSKSRSNHCYTVQGFDFHIFTPSFFFIFIFMC